MAKVDCNLLSISKLTRDLNCSTNFSSKSCKFQDLSSGNMIGNAKVCDGFYLLGNKRSHEGRHHPPKCFSPIFVSSSISCLNKDDAIMLSHYHLGHPNFIYLAKCFLHCFINKNRKL